MIYDSDGLQEKELFVIDGYKMLSNAGKQW